MYRLLAYQTYYYSNYSGIVMSFNDHKRFWGLIILVHQSLLELLAMMLTSFWLISRRSYIIMDPLTLMEFIILPISWWICLRIDGGRSLVIDLLVCLLQLGLDFLRPFESDLYCIAWEIKWLMCLITWIRDPWLLLSMCLIFILYQHIHLLESPSSQRGFKYFEGVRWYLSIFNYSVGSFMCFFLVLVIIPKWSSLLSMLLEKVPKMFSIMVSFVYSPPKVEISILWVLMVIKVGYLRSLCRIRW